MKRWIVGRQIILKWVTLAGPSEPEKLWRKADMTDGAKEAVRWACNIVFSISVAVVLHSLFLLFTMK
jgi:hypothetical protein